MKDKQYAVMIPHKQWQNARTIAKIMNNDERERYKRERADGQQDAAQPELVTWEAVICYTLERPLILHRVAIQQGVKNE